MERFDIESIGDEFPVDQCPALVGGGLEDILADPVDRAEHPDRGFVDQRDGISSKHLLVEPGLREPKADVVPGILGVVRLQAESVPDPTVEAPMAPQLEAVPEFR